MFWHAPNVERLREGAVDVFNVKEHLERARALLEAGDEASVRYACLEMRFAIEKIVYRKLSKLTEKIPPAIYRTWQPNKAMKLLLNFEPQADQNVKVAVSSVAEDGSPAGDWSDLGEARAFKLQWLNKYNNKLGGYSPWFALSILLVECHSPWASEMRSRSLFQCGLSCFLIEGAFIILAAR